jgi:uncharacterized protein YbcI
MCREPESDKEAIAVVNSERLTGGRLNAALANAIVQIHNEYLGRGPSKGKAFFRDTVIVVLMEETMTKAERSLANSGREDIVLARRLEFLRTMEDDVIEAVEGLTGCKVVAFMSDTHIDPDMAVEVFVLDRPCDPTQAGERSDSNGDPSD